MAQKVKRGNLAVPAFYSLVGFIMAIGLQASCNFVERKLVLSYTKRPTFAPTVSFSEVPSAQPSVYLPPTAAPSDNVTAAATDVPTVASTGDGGGESPGGGGASSAQPTSMPTVVDDPTVTRQPTVATTAGPTIIVDSNSTQATTQQPTVLIEPISEVDGVGDQDTSGNRRLQNGTSVPTGAPPANTSQPTITDKEIIQQLEQRIIHKVGLWDWEVQDGICVPYTVCIETKACFSPSFDSAFNAARTFAVLSSMLGGIVTLIICAALCFPFNPVYLTPVYVVLILFQGLSLMVYSSGICDTLGDVSFWLGAGGENVDPITGELTDDTKEIEAYLTANTEVTCTNGAGSKMAISAVVMWFLAVITCFWNVKRTRDI